MLTHGSRTRSGPGKHWTGPLPLPQRPDQPDLDRCRRDRLQPAGLAPPALPDRLLARAERKTLRYRILRTNARIIRGQRRRTIRIPETWPGQWKPPLPERRDEPNPAHLTARSGSDPTSPEETHPSPEPAATDPTVGPPGRNRAPLSHQ